MIRTMRNTFAILTFTVFASTGWAAPPTDESLVALFRVMRAEALLDTVYATIEPAMRQAMAQAAQGKTLTDEQRKVMELAPQRLGAVMRAELSWERLQPMQIAIYRESFEQGEVDELIEFYKSPLGQKFVSKMPVVTQKAMVAMQAYMRQVMPKLEEAMKQVLSEAKLLPAR